MRKAGWSYRAIGGYLQRTDTLCKSAGSNGCCEKLIDEMNALEGQKCTNARQDEMIVRQVLTSPMVSLSTIQRATFSSLPAAAPSTISQRLAEAGLRSQRPLGRMLLTPQHRGNHLKWCRCQSS
ncbi:hypothetical protein TNCV_2981151 [Trichonephila clavipes]|nr:hypothetical protein TNCV_2981151 [Trichonephila clavipes]